MIIIDIIAQVYLISYQILGKIIHISSNAAYSVKSNEEYINSGLLFPKGKGPPNGSTSFTLTFEKVGTYNYY